ncbi:apoptosis-related protein [Babesia caballi]|uniref:Apoptosis-related protein n=1 Tax=Babesia caballi TaxID=5871 RepID=A0AAV4LSY1_BABCB|nr:apoptosis-related protein [Babesia caballi]
MVPFAYLRRATDVGALQRLLRLQEHVVPQTIKFVAARALGSPDSPGEGDYAVKGGLGSGGTAVERGRAKEGRLEIAELIQESIAHTKAEEWETSSIITVVYYLSKARVPLKEATRAIFSQKVTQVHELNVLDFWQALQAARTLRVEVPVRALRRHFEDNVGALLAGASCKNVYSVLSAFSACGEALSTWALEVTAAHYREKIQRPVDFRDCTNFANALAVQVDLALEAGEGIVGGHGRRRDGAGRLTKIVDDLIEECIGSVHGNCADIEGMADLLDTMVMARRWRGSNDEDARRAVGMQELADEIYRSLTGAETTSVPVGDSSNVEWEMNRHQQPRVLRVVLRCLRRAGLLHPQLLATIVDRYRRRPTSWSAQGNAEVLRCAAFYGLCGPEVSDIAKHVGKQHQCGFGRHVDAAHTFVNACVLASQSSDERGRARCRRLVAAALANVDGINRRDLALGMMVLRLSPDGYSQIPLNNRDETRDGRHGPAGPQPGRAKRAAGVAEHAGGRRRRRPAHAVQKQMQEEAKRESILEARRMALRTLLTVEAQERLNRIAMVKPEKATQIENFLLQTAFKGGRRNKMEDAELKHLIEVGTMWRRVKAATWISQPNA